MESREEKIVGAIASLMKEISKEYKWTTIGDMFCDGDYLDRLEDLYDTVVYRLEKLHDSQNNFDEVKSKYRIALRNIKRMRPHIVKIINTIQIINWHTANSKVEWPLTEEESLLYAKLKEEKILCVNEFKAMDLPDFKFKEHIARINSAMRKAKNIERHSGEHKHSHIYSLMVIIDTEYVKLHEEWSKIIEDVSAIREMIVNPPIQQFIDKYSYT